MNLLSLQSIYLQKGLNINPYMFRQLYFSKPITIFHFGLLEKSVIGFVFLNMFCTFPTFLRKPAHHALFSSLYIENLGSQFISFASFQVGSTSDDFSLNTTQTQYPRFPKQNLRSYREYCSRPFSRLRLARF